MPHGNGQATAQGAKRAGDDRPDSFLYRQNSELVSAAGGPATQVLQHTSATRAFDVIQSAHLSFDEVSASSTDVTMEMQWRRSPNAGNIISQQVTFTLGSNAHRNFLGTNGLLVPGQVLRPDHAVRVTVLHDSGAADVNVNASLILARYRSHAARSISQR